MYSCHDVADGQQVLRGGSERVPTTIHGRRARVVDANLLNSPRPGGKRRSVIPRNYMKRPPTEPEAPGRFLVHPEPLTRYATFGNRQFAGSEDTRSAYVPTTPLGNAGLGECSLGDRAEATRRLAKWAGSYNVSNREENPCQRPAF